MKFPDDRLMTQVELEAQRFTSLKRVDVGVLRSKRMDVQRAFDADEMEARLTAFVSAVPDGRGGVKVSHPNGDPLRHAEHGFTAW